MNFFKLFIASILGTIAGIVILTLFFLMGILSGSAETEPYIRTNTVLEIEISGDIPSRSAQDPIQELLFATGPRAVSLDMLRSNLKKAAVDENISGVWLKINQVSASWANLETAYGYLEEYKESGKFLYAGTDDIGFNENGWYLAAQADSIFSPPVTGFEFNGFAMMGSYYRGLLDKIGVEPEIMRVGEYKSAVEPFMSEGSSPEHRQQVNEILNDVTTTFIEAVQRKTGFSPEQINSLLTDMPADPVRHALDNRLIDVIAFPTDMERIIKQRAGLNDDDDLRTVTIQRYDRISSSSVGVNEPESTDRIAILNASGMIIPDIATGLFGTEQVITANGIKEALKDILDDDDIKAIVLNINSPGGSASTSDLIWDYIRDAATQKPVVAYMGEVAASGGYYIAMGADTVIASPNTITGSIGIYSLMFNTQELFEEHLGINNEAFTSHEHADILQMVRPLTEAERSALQRNVEQGYSVFLDRVANSREMEREEIDELARGRVWSGMDAEQVGLVDATGDLDYALEVAAEMAGIDEYRTVIYPEEKDLFELVFSSTQATVSRWARSFTGIPEELHMLNLLSEQVKGGNWMLLPVELKAR